MNQLVNRDFTFGIKDSVRTRMVRSFPLIFVALVMSFAVIPVICAQASDQDFEVIRQQTSIKSSYNFSSLPPNAGKGITVALVSQGISRSLEQYLGSRVSAYSVLPNDSSPYDEDEWSIGPGVASLVGALAPQSKIIAIKVLGSDGNGEYLDIQNGITRAVDLGANIIILPIGANDDNAGVAEAIRNALGKGILIVASAGNDQHSGAEFPANMEGVVAVGATDTKDKVAYFSNYGGRIIFAPGCDIKCEGNMDDKGKSGTSHAAPVAGAIFAVLWSQNPTLTREQLITAVLGSAKKIKDPDGNPAKLIDGQAALPMVKIPR